MLPATHMNLTEIKANRLACLDAFDTLTALQNKHGFNSPEWLVCHEVKKLVLAQSMEFSRIIEQEEAKAG